MAFSLAVAKKPFENVPHKPDAPARAVLAGASGLCKTGFSFLGASPGSAA
jgi:hypothetical protein